MEVGEGGHEPYPWRQTRQDKHNYDYEFQTEDGDDYEVVQNEDGLPKLRIWFEML